MSGATAAMLFGVLGAPGVINGSLPNATGIAGTGGWELFNDGTYGVTNGVGTSTGNWIAPPSTSIAVYYQVKVDATSGTFTSGTTGTFLDLSSNQAWSKTGGSVTFTVTIREKATGFVRSTQTGLSIVA